MTNLEKYENEIKLYAYSLKVWAVVNGEITGCHEASCKKCLFHNPDSESCMYGKAKYEWLKSEYKEQEVDWSKVAVDTPILVSVDGIKWERRYFAKYERERIYAWSTGTTSWTTTGCALIWNYAKLAEEGAV